MKTLSCAKKTVDKTVKSTEDKTPGRTHTTKSSSVRGISFLDETEKNKDNREKCCKYIFQREICFKD